MDPPFQLFTQPAYDEPPPMKRFRSGSFTRPIFAVGAAASPFRRTYRRRFMRPPRTAAGRLPAGTGRTRVSSAVRDTPIYAPVLPASRQEMHYIDVGSASYAMDTTGTITHINRVVVGDTVNDRQGSRFRNLGVIVRGFASSNSATTATKGAWMVVWDRSPAGALPGITSILETVSSDSFQNTGTRDRFRILCRFDYAFVGNSTTPVTGREYFSVNQKTDFNQLTAYTDSGLADIANVNTGAIYLVTVGDTAAGTGAATLTVTTRLLFADI